MPREFFFSWEKNNGALIWVIQMTCFIQIEEANEQVAFIQRFGSFYSKCCDSDSDSEQTLLVDE